MKLADYFDQYKCDKGNIKHQYNRVYEPALEPLRNLPIRLLEIGVFKGASLQAWADYLPHATFVGVDIFERVDIPKIPILNHPRVSWVKCSSTDELPVELLEIVGDGFDIIIDDGLHTHDGQRLTFENFIPFLKPDGKYFIEDVWPFDLMDAREKQHQWLVKHPNDFSDDQYIKLLKATRPYNVKFHDLRKGFGPDTFIIEVTK